jgi:hypothetical protein
MRENLKAYLRDECGLDDEAIAKLERGEKPSADSNVLRKAVPPKIRDMLRHRGASEEVVDRDIRRIEHRGGEPDEDPIVKLRKLDPHSPTLAKIDEVNALLEKIKADFAKFHRYMSQPVSQPNLSGFRAEGLNGHDAVFFDGRDWRKDDR